MDINKTLNVIRQTMHELRPNKDFTAAETVFMDGDTPFPSTGGVIQLKLKYLELEQPNVFETTPVIVFADMERNHDAVVLWLYPYWEIDYDYDYRQYSATSDWRSYGWLQCRAERLSDLLKRSLGDIENFYITNAKETARELLERKANPEDPLRITAMEHFYAKLAASHAAQDPVP